MKELPMKLYHVSTNGELAKCSASSRPCPRGNHFTDKDFGQEYVDIINEGIAEMNKHPQQELSIREKYYNKAKAHLEKKYNPSSDVMFNVLIDLHRENDFDLDKDNLAYYERFKERVTSPNDFEALKKIRADLGRTDEEDINWLYKKIKAGCIELHHYRRNNRSNDFSFTIRPNYKGDYTSYDVDVVGEKTIIKSSQGFYLEIPKRFDHEPMDGENKMRCFYSEVRYANEFNSGELGTQLIDFIAKGVTNA